MKNKVLIPLVINSVAFCLAFVLLLPINIWLWATLNNRFYYNYIFLFTFFLLLFYQLRMNRSLGGLLSQLLFGLLAGYISSLLGYVGTSLLEMKRFVFPFNLDDAIYLTITIPLMLFGWLYAIIMGTVSWFIYRKIG